MLRSHRGLLAASLAAFFALTSVDAFGQQDPAAQTGGRQRGQGGPGGGGPGGGGPGGGGPGGGWGGPGGRGGNQASIPTLLQSAAVQAELKLTDAQKSQIADINAKSDEKRNALFQKMGRGNRGGNNNGNNGGNNNGGNAGPSREERQAIMEEVTALQQSTEAALAKVLDAKQKTRVTQIALQVEGPQAFVSEKLVAKLTLEDEQVSDIREILNELRTSQRDAMRAAFGNNGGPGGNNGGPGGNNGRGGRGNNAAPGGNNAAPGATNTARNAPAGATPPANSQDDAATARPARPDPNSPEMQARFAQMQKDRLKQNDAAMAAIGKVLSAVQKSIYKKLIGDKFDVSKIETRRPGGPGGPGGPPNATATTAAATKPATTTATTAATKPAAKKSLSERRAGAAAAAPK